jgi:hypothetical protein
MQCCTVTFSRRLIYKMEDSSSKDVKSMEKPPKQASTNMEVDVSINQYKFVQICTFVALFWFSVSNPQFAAQANSSFKHPAITPSNNAPLQYIHTKHPAISWKKLRNWNNKYGCRCKYKLQHYIAELFGPGHFVGLGHRLKSEIRTRTRTKEIVTFLHLDPKWSVSESFIFGENIVIHFIAILLQRPVYCFWRAHFHGQGVTRVTPDNFMYSLPTILPCCSGRSGARYFK